MSDTDQQPAMEQQPPPAAEAQQQQQQQQEQQQQQQQEQPTPAPAQPAPVTLDPQVEAKLLKQVTAALLFRMLHVPHACKVLKTGQCCAPFAGGVLF